MYFTDGEARAPENARGHILWIISSNGSAYEEFPGLIINIENKK
jgi:predicted metal-dependent peptidase